MSYAKNNQKEKKMNRETAERNIIAGKKFTLI